MYKLDLPVAAIPKIGPKYKALLNKLEIYTIGDLMYHFPFRHDDFSKVLKVKDIQVTNENITVQGILGKIDNIFTRYGKRITKATFVDETGSIDAIWFNSHFLKNTLEQNKTYNLSGKIGSFSGKKALVAPEYERVGDTALNTGRLVPIYSETTGISSKWIRTRINDLIKAGLEYEEFLPNEIINSEKLPEIKHALTQFHFPSSLDTAKKAEYRFAFEELFLELINVESRKQEWHKNIKGQSLNVDKYKKLLEQLTKSLPFKLTISQQSAIQSILENIQKEHPMNRLLEGDVGSGKTIVAVFAAYLTYLNGYNTIYMAPTEILAKQHYDTFKKLLEPFNVQIELLTGNSKPTKQNETEILIGTHALLHKTDHKKVGLVIIDEQHRFGVEQRAKLMQLNDNTFMPHLLTMTATPIPRTLALTIYGDLEISTLKELPNKDKKITTKVVSESSREKVFKWIAQQNEQTFIVCPFIEESESENLGNIKAAKAEYERLKNDIFKNTPIGLLHGKLTPKEKKEIVDKFRSGEIKVLVSTPVIEVGIDVPEATIIVIESAERYGLASLHQLRGRVGRGSKEGFCFVFMSNNSRVAYKRLKYLENINEGLKLAEIDLEMRGYGDLYGTMQHGFKKFKVANITDTELLEKAKKYAQEYFDKLNEFPLLKQKVKNASGELVGNN